MHSVLRRFINFILRFLKVVSNLFEARMISEIILQNLNVFSISRGHKLQTLYHWSELINHNVNTRPQRNYFFHFLVIEFFDLLSDCLWFWLLIVLIFNKYIKIEIVGSLSRLADKLDFLAVWTIFIKVIIESI